MRKSTLNRKTLDFFWSESQRLFDQLVNYVYNSPSDKPKYEKLRQRYLHIRDRYNQARKDYFNNE